MYTYKLDSNINVTPLLDEVMRYPHDRFNEDTGRSQIQEIVDARTIPLKTPHPSVYGVVRNMDPKSRQLYIQNQRIRVPGKYYNDYPLIIRFLTEFTEKYGGSLVAAGIVALPAGGRVDSHTDEGKYYIGRDRFHLVLSGEYQYTVQGQTNVYTAGDLWWFDNSKQHSAYAHTTKDCMRVIFDAEEMQGLFDCVQ